jgi:hypothetical protein
MRLFLCAFFRHCEHRDQRVDPAVEVAEQFADGLMGWKEVRRARGLVGQALAEEIPDYHDPSLDLAIGTLSWNVLNPEQVYSLVRGVPEWPWHPPLGVLLLRDLFGNLFHATTVDPNHLTPVVLSLAQAAYEERLLPSGELDLARLGVLSDALEETGCTDADILGHLRSPGPHVRGCWVLDKILGKE